MDEMENEMLNTPGFRGEVEDRQEQRIIIEELERDFKLMLRVGDIDEAEYEEGMKEVKKFKSEYRTETNPSRTSVKLRLLQKRLLGSKAPKKATRDPIENPVVEIPVRELADAMDSELNGAPEAKDKQTEKKQKVTTDG